MAQVAPIGSVGSGAGRADGPRREGPGVSPLGAPGKLPPISGSTGALKSDSMGAAAGEGATLQATSRPSQLKASGFASKPILPSIDNTAKMHAAGGAVGAGDEKEALARKPEVGISAAPKPGFTMPDSLGKVRFLARPERPVSQTTAANANAAFRRAHRYHPCRPR